jgi:hypothetical protein
MMPKRLLPILLIFAATTVNAADLSRRFGAGLRAGGAFPIGPKVVRDKGSFGPTAGFRLRWADSENLSYVFDYDHLRMGGDRGVLADSLTVGAVYAFGIEDIRPTILLGISGTSLERIPNQDRQYSNLGTKLGFGVEMMVTEDTMIGLDAAYHYVTSLIETNTAVSASTFGISFTHFFERMKKRRSRPGLGAIRDN